MKNNNPEPKKKGVGVPIILDIPPPTDQELRAEIEIIVGAAYAGGAIDKANNRDTKLDFGKIPENSKVRMAVKELEQLIQREREVVQKHWRRQLQQFKKNQNQTLKDLQEKVEGMKLEEQAKQGFGDGHNQAITDVSNLIKEML